ncbi:MAG: transcriptional regulator BetI [Alphaproteobacteria bacterium]
MRKKMGVIRRAELARATFDTLVEDGLKDMTVARISRRAGLTQGLVHHYFKSKEEMVEAAIRLASSAISKEVVTRLATSATPRDRVVAVIDGNLAPSVLTQGVTQAWLAFGTDSNGPETRRRLLRVIDRRMQSNLRSALRLLLPDAAVADVALGIATMIDGTWMHCALSHDEFNAEEARQRIVDYLDMQLDRRGTPPPD